MKSSHQVATTSSTSFSGTYEYNKDTCRDYIVMIFIMKIVTLKVYTFEKRDIYFFFSFSFLSDCLLVFYNSPIDHIKTIPCIVAHRVKTEILKCKHLLILARPKTGLRAADITGDCSFVQRSSHSSEGRTSASKCDRFSSWWALSTYKLLSSQIELFQKWELILL